MSYFYDFEKKNREIWRPETNFAEQRGSCLKPIKLGRMGSLYVYVSDVLELSEMLNMSTFVHLFYKESKTVCVETTE